MTPSPFRSFARSSLHALALAAVPLVACSSNSSSGPSPFNGSWSCTTTSTYTITSPTGKAPFTEVTTSKVDLDIMSGDTVTLQEASVDGGKLGDGGAGCSVSYSTSGNMALLVPGQSCAVVLSENNLTVNLNLVYTTGSGTVMGNMMNFSGSDTFTGTAASGAISEMLAGKVSGATTCTN